MRTVCRVIALICVLYGGVVSSAQVLARPGWAGSGVSVEPWWRRAVLYRIAPAVFQDSDGDGIGDVRGIAQRLEYLQQLGVDAIVLAPPFNEDEFGDLARKASDSHVRVLAEIDSADIGKARFWLNQGAAGLLIDAHQLSGDTTAQMRALRKLVDGFPGERVLVSEGGSPGSDTAHLRVAAELNADHVEATQLHAKLSSSVAGADATSESPLLQLSGTARPQDSPEQAAIDDRALAVALLASRAAVMFDAGRELGLRSADGTPVAMQWTPANVTREEPKPEAVAPKPKVEVYGAYTPYIPPPKIALPVPLAPKVVESAVPPLVNPDSLPGFTSGDLHVSVAANGEVTNAASEDTDPGSLLNFYRHLIALHHGNWSLRNGTQYMVDRNAQHAAVWLRRAPAGSRTAASVVVASNTTGQPVELDLRHDLDGLHMRGGYLRPLLTASTTELLSSSQNLLPPESAEHLVLPARTVFLGELFHEDTSAGRSSGKHRRK